MKSRLAARRALESLGYAEDAADAGLRMKLNPRATAGFPQIYILDPDHNVIEINAERLDTPASGLRVRETPLDRR